MEFLTDILTQIGSMQLGERGWTLHEGLGLDRNISECSVYSRHEIDITVVF